MLLSRETQCFSLLVFYGHKNADTLAIGNECKNEIHRLFGIDGKNIS